jgi:hypothetical protein
VEDEVGLLIDQRADRGDAPADRQHEVVGGVARTGTKTQVQQRLSGAGAELAGLGVRSLDLFGSVEAASPGAAERIYVGDNPEMDFVTPNLRGWRTVGVRHPENLRPWVEGLGDGRPGVWVESLVEVLARA